MRHPYLLIYSEQRREKITTTHHSRPHSCPCSANLHPLWDLSFPLIANAVFPPPLSILSAILPLTYEFISAIVSQYDIGTAAAIASSVDGNLDLDHPPVRRVVAMAAHWDNLWHQHCIQHSVGGVRCNNNNCYCCLPSLGLWPSSPPTDDHT